LDSQETNSLFWHFYSVNPFHLILSKYCSFIFMFLEGPGLVFNWNRSGTEQSVRVQLLNIEKIAFTNTAWRVWNHCPPLCFLDVTEL
jgi:hypothetical protein